MVQENQLENLKRKGVGKKRTGANRKKTKVGKKTGVGKKTKRVRK